MSLPSDPAEFLALDSRQRANLLLAGLADCPENACGRNFLLFQLQAWFPEFVAAPGILQGGGDPSVRRMDIEHALEDAYARLQRDGLIRPNPRAGNTFCKVNRRGEILPRSLKAA